VLDERYAQIASSAAMGKNRLVDRAPRFCLRETQFMTKEFIKLLRFSFQAKACLLLEDFVLVVELAGELAELILNQAESVLGCLRQ